MAEKESLRNELDIEIPYVDDSGKNGLKKVHIKFISQTIYAEYTQLIETISEAVSLGEKVKKTSESIGYEIASKRNIKVDSDGNVSSTRKTLFETRDAVKRLVEEAERCNARINEISSHMNEKKFHLINAVLLKNQIDDPDLCSMDWWLSCVDMEDMMNFIVTACTKDNSRINSKKKVRTKGLSTM
jgi:hypothetical protein